MVAARTAGSAEVNRARAAGPVADEPLLERERELELIGDALARAGGGTGQLVVIEGRAGLGKTSLQAAAGQAAVESGFRVLRARGSELERDFPFGAVLQLFEPALLGAGAEERSALLEGAAGLAAPLFDPARAGDIQADALFSRVHGLYWLASNLSEAGPLAILVDDVHWIDTPSLRFLLYLAGRIEDSSIALLVSVRPEEHGEAPELLAQLLVHPLGRSVALAPLTEGAAAQVVSRKLPSADDVFSRACAEVCGGNPFLLRELLGELVAEGVEPTAGLAPRVGSYAPEAVSRAVLIRLLRLPDRASRLARAVAVLGDGTPLARAAALADLELELARAAADALAASDVLEPVDPLRFVHPLVRSAVYADLPAAERAAAHLRAAHLMAADHEGVERVAAHLLHAPPTGDAWVVEQIRAAADRASGQGAPESAVQLLSRALNEPPTVDQRPEVLVSLGEAEAAGGDARAFDHLEEAASLTEDPARRAAIRSLLGRRLMMGGRFPEAAEAFDTGLADLGDGDGADSDLVTQLDAGYISAARLDVASRPKALERLERLRERPPGGSSATERLLFGTLAFEAAVSGAPHAEVIDFGRRALRDGGQAGEDAGDSAGFIAAVTALGYAEDLDTAAAVLTDEMERARELGSLLRYARAATFRAFVHYRRGHLREAIADSSAALDHSALDAQIGGPATNAVLALAFMERAETEAARQVLDVPDVERRSAHAPYAYFLEARGRLSLSTGDPQAALDDFLACGQLLESLRAPNPAVAAWRSWAARAADRVGDRERALQLAHDELELARRFGAPRATAISLRAVGALEGGDAGIERLREAGALLDSSPARLERARTLVDLGAALRRENQRAAARDPLEEGFELARACEAIALAERAADELAAAGTPPKRERLSGLESLTASERRVAEMAATGLTNREIAQRLFVTVKAVQWHLGNVYRKLDLAGRGELGPALRGERD